MRPLPPERPKFLHIYPHTVDAICQEIKERRIMLRTHRDATGDNRCWLADFYYVFRMLKRAPSAPTQLLPLEEAMKRCKRFHTFCGSKEPPQHHPDAILDPARWDEDLARLARKDLEWEKLINKLYAIQQAAQKLLDRYYEQEANGPALRVSDYKELYEVLPEKIAADFRLPPREEFLMQALPHKGCPNFWQSHLICPNNVHNLDEWGPCQPQ